MIEQIEAEIFHAFQTRGYSHPARLTCRSREGERKDIIVKFAGGVRDHYFGLCAELLCSLIARQLGFSTADPYVVNLSPEFLAGVPPEAKDLVSRSVGLNFGSIVVGGYGVMPTEPQLTKNLLSVAAEIFAFDILIQNFDRKWDNPNLLWNGEKIMLIDHESALNSILQWPDDSLTNLNLDRFYDHIFYSAISPQEADYRRLEAALGAMTPPVIEGFFTQLPAVWRDERALLRIGEYLKFLVANRKIVCETIYERVS